MDRGIQSQKMKYYKKVGKMFKTNNIDSRTTVFDVV